jgi:hypothetical protein
MKWDMLIVNKDCNEIFDRGYYTVGRSDLVQNWPVESHGILIVCKSIYIIQIAITISNFVFRFNNSDSDKNRWEPWQTIK